MASTLRVRCPGALVLQRRLPIRPRCHRSLTVHAMKATWNGKTLAESSDTVVVERNHYFPPTSLNRQYFKDSSKHTTCGWKGEASYYDVEVDGQTNKEAAWYYPKPKDAAKNIQDYVAFWKGVTVEG